MLSVLRAIVQEVNAARNLEQALQVIVSRLKEALTVDVCSVYLADNSGGELVLQATDGLRPESVGRVRLSPEQGLVGLVAQRAEPINLGDAPQHPRYVYFAETGEEQYHAFLGVPVIQQREVLGVLVVQQHAETPYDEDSVTLLLTIAAQLAGAITHARAEGEFELPAGHSQDSRPLPGQPGASGVAIGKALVVRPPADIDTIPDLPADDPDGERERLFDAVAQVRSDVAEMVERMSGALPAGDVALFEAYQLMLESDSFVGAAAERIVSEGVWAPGALARTVREHVRAFEAMDDPYLRERGQDIRDLGRRILQRLQEQEHMTAVYPRETVLVGEEVTASMLAEAPTGHIIGVVSGRGSRTSHVAILARAMGIPAVLGVSDLPLGRMDGLPIIVDGYGGRIYLKPSETVLGEYRRLQQEERELSAGLRGIRHLVSETPDGHRVQLLANTGLVSDITPSLKSGAEGIGLYRTEFPFMIREGFPGEESQFQVYRQVLEAFHPRPVTMRTLDVGGDKALPYFPISEDNPFLGWRGVRITLDHPEIFTTQIRAMLRASEGLGNLRLLLPMVSTLSEVDESLALIRRVHAELLEDGYHPPMPQVGAMVEVPAVVFQAEQLAGRVDFLSVGSNDLTQYLLAVDRNNARVADLYEPLHPAVLYTIQHVVKSAHKAGKPVSVCGEMAGDPAAALLLLGMGVDSLSMSSASLLRIKWVVRSFCLDQAQALVAEVLAMDNAADVRERVQALLEEAGMGGLVRAGK